MSHHARGWRQTKCLAQELKQKEVEEALREDEEMKSHIKKDGEAPPAYDEDYEYYEEYKRNRENEDEEEPESYADDWWMYF